LAGALLASLSVPAQAQQPRRAALLIANSEYGTRSVAAAAADAQLMRSMLGEFRFEGKLIENAGLGEMRNAVDAFAGNLGPGDAALLYYAGFCAQSATDTYLIPVDFQGQTDADWSPHAIAVRELEARIGAKGSRLKVVALTGCRDYTDSSWRGTTLGPADASVAFILAMEPTPATDQTAATNGRFMVALRDAFGGRDMDLLGVLLNAASRFGTAVNDPTRAQVSWTLSGAAKDFWLRMQPREAAAKPPATSTVRDFLVRGRREESGYGLYSYLLFPTRPAPAEEARCREVISVYLKMLQDAGSSSFPRRQLNITYIPVTGFLGSQPTADQVLASYDYDRALLMLRAQRGSGALKGPYVLSSLVPLADATAQTDVFIFQDLSSVPQSLIPLYIREFEAQASQDRSWSSEAMAGFLLGIRTAISRVANEGASAAPAFTLIIDLFKKAQ
jgi:hypothetical protein